MMMLSVLTIIGLLISVTRISTAALCSQSDDDAFEDASDFIIKLPTEITKRGNTDANDTVCVESIVNSKCRHGIATI